MLEIGSEFEYKKVERSLRKINMLAYKKLVFQVIPELKNGDLSTAKKVGDLYEVDLPTDYLFEHVYEKFKLRFKKEDKKIVLVDITPKEVLLKFMDGITMYKGVPVPEKNSEKYRFKRDLLSAIYED